MRYYLCSVLACLSLMLSAKPASACLAKAELELEDIKYASVVVIGRVKNYKIVPDQVARARHKERLAQPDLSPELRMQMEDQNSFSSDYAQFEVVVEEVLVGTPPEVLTVTWNNSTFGEPKQLEEGPFLIALRDPSSNSPRLRGPSATIVPPRDRQLLTVLQAPCAPPLMFKSPSIGEKSVRDILARSR